MKLVLPTMHYQNSLMSRNAEKLQLAMTRLAELDQQAEREKIHGKVVVELIYQNGKSDRVRAVLEAHYK